MERFEVMLIEATASEQLEYNRASANKNKKERLSIELNVCLVGHCFLS